MTYKLLRSEILFCLALSVCLTGRYGDPAPIITDAKRCSEVHNEQRGEFDSGLQKMSQRQHTGVKPLFVDKTKIFQPPKVSDMGAPKPKTTPLATPVKSEEEYKSKEIPRAMKAQSVPDMNGQYGMSSGMRQNSVPGFLGRQAVTPQPYNSPTQGGFNNQPNSGRAVPEKSLPNSPFGTSPVRRANIPKTPLPQAPEMVRLKVHYLDKRLVEIPKERPTFLDVKARVESKFTTQNLILKYQTSSGAIKTISSQKDLDAAMAENLQVLYVNRPGEVNQFEPQSGKTSTKGGNSDWQECYTETGDKYYFNVKTNESAWELPTTSSPQSNNGFGSKGNSNVSNGFPKANSSFTNSYTSKPQPKNTADWIECWTETGDKYYFNTSTQESSWDQPR